ncbi:hypothetical protein IQ07DRAFT_553657 [Pyrenochaeta sp. DS3sAY3a]|nr:hypothetical protein IQ07DRAFT_553657 [Pyrenochaeta sp. DS3sAY3a]
MGNCGSNGMNAAANGEQSLPNARPGPPNAIMENRMQETFPDYTTEPSLGSKQQPVDGRPHFNIQPQKEGLPSYELHNSVDIFRNITIAANNLGMCGIQSTFDVLRQRHFEVYMDSAHTLHKDTFSAILLTALYTLGNAKAKDSDMTFYFTSYPNTKSPSLSGEKRGWIKALIKLWRTQNWPEAVQAIENDRNLKDLGFDDWLRVNNFKDSDPDEEKHFKLLNHTRQTMVPLWHGWHQRELDPDLLQALFHTALKASRKQLKSLNSVRITYERSIKHYLRNFRDLRDDPTREVAPTTILFLVGSPLQPSELNAIKLCQGEGKELFREIAQHKRQKLFGGRQKLNTEKQEPSELDRTGSQFQICTLLHTGHLDNPTIERFKEIDNFAWGDDDINDLLIVQESDILGKFLSPKALFKLFNTHHPQVDQMELARNDIYSEYQLIATFGDVNTIVVPTIKQFEVIHGIEDLDNLKGIEDSDDENDAAPIGHKPCLAKVNVVALAEGASSVIAVDTMGSAKMATGPKTEVNLWASDE